MLQDIEKYYKNVQLANTLNCPTNSFSSDKDHITWQTMGKMVAVDILEVPVSQHNNDYLLFIQDYMNKWAEAIPFPNQIAEWITEELIKVFGCFGIPNIL